MFYQLFYSNELGNRNCEVLFDKHPTANAESNPDATSADTGPASFKKWLAFPMIIFACFSQSIVGDASVLKSRANL